MIFNFNLHWQTALNVQVKCRSLNQRWGSNHWITRAWHSVMYLWTVTVSFVPADAYCEWCVVKQGRVSLPLPLVHVFQKSMDLFLYIWSLWNKKGLTSFSSIIIFPDTFQSAFIHCIIIYIFIICNVQVLLPARFLGWAPLVHRSTDTWWRSRGKSACYAQRQSFLLLNNCISFPLNCLQ